MTGTIRSLPAAVLLFVATSRLSADPPPAKLPAAVVASAENNEPIECGAEALKRFSTKVQPILMNACSGCHAGRYTGKFHLDRTYADGLNTRAATLRNLNATLPLIDRAKPAASALLQRAVTAHGGSVLPPLRDRGALAFKQLDEWVKLTIGDGTAPAAEAKVETTAADGNSDFGAATPKKDAPQDPFDPMIFNRQYHPDRSPKP
jgi:hypothetical protein